MTEQRRGRRRDTDVAVRFVALPATIGSGRITNVSLTGAFMETACKLPLRTVVYIEGLDSGKERNKNGAIQRLSATVIRRCTAGVGLEWCAPRPDIADDSDMDVTPAAPGGEGRCLYRLEFID